MKHILIIFSLFSLPAFADNQPLITKTSGSGFVQPDYARGESCEVYQDHVVVRKYYGRGETRVVSEETLAVKLSPGILDVITKASAEKVVESNGGPCDVPVSTVSFTKGDDKLLLFATGECGNARKLRTGPYSQMLNDLVSVYCPKTYDFKPAGGN